MHALLRLLKLLLVLALAAGGFVFWWLQHPLPMSSDTVDLSIEPGRSPRAVAQDVAAAGIAVDPRLLYLWFRLSGQDRLIRAGSYELDRQTTPRTLLAKLVRGDEASGYVTLVEGWNFRQVRAALAKAEKLKPDTASMSDQAIMQALGRPDVAAEGRFFPDTYTYSKGSSDLALLRRALAAMDKKLDAAWAKRAPDTPLRSASDALVLASIVEKETGKVDDRSKIAGVFTNRLKINMPLQTDPSVIYGMGTAFDGNLRKADLLRDAPYNSYTRQGLPPTAIALPGRDALRAAARPDPTKALYFVARGDGTSVFSETLNAHNAAVNQYQRGPKGK